MAKLKLPKVGEKVRIYTRPYFSWHKSNPPIEGVVAEGVDYAPDSLRLQPASNWINVSIIRIDSIVRIEKLDKLSNDMSRFEAAHRALSGDAGHVHSNAETSDNSQKFYVKGSKGDIYTVTKRGNSFTCTCIAGSMGRLCKHVKQVQSELEKK